MTKITKSYRILTVTVQDTEPPILIIQRPTPGEIVTIQPLTVSGSSADVGSGLDYIEVSLDGGSFMRAVGTANWAANINNVLNGSHTARARARDKAGNLSAERSVFFSVNRTITPPPPPPPVGPPPPPPTGSSTWIPWTPGPTRVNVTSVAGIQAAITTIRNAGSGTVHINPGTYTIPAAGIALGGVNNIIFEGSGRDTTHLVCGADNGTILTKSGTTKTSNVWLRNIDIDGANRSRKILNFVNIKNLRIDNTILQRHNDPFPGVYIEDLDGGLAEYNRILNPSGRGDAFAIGGYRLTFRNNEIVRTNAPGGGFTSGGLVDSKILNNNIHDFKGYSATSLENFHSRADGKYSFKNVEVAYNTYTKLTNPNLNGIGDSGSNAISSLGYATSSDVPPNPEPFSMREFYNINVHHNNVTTATGGIRMNATDKQPNSRTYNSDISDNTLINTAGIAAGPYFQSRINRNTVNGTSGYRGYGVYIYPVSDGVTMTGNKLTNLAKAAYYYVGSTNITVIP